jgi:hypothetical protein
MHFSAMHKMHQAEEADEAEQGGQNNGAEDHVDTPFFRARDVARERRRAERRFVKEAAAAIFFGLGVPVVELAGLEWPVLRCHQGIFRVRATLRPPAIAGVDGRFSSALCQEMTLFPRIASCSVPRAMTPGAGNDGQRR